MHQQVTLGNQRKVPVRWLVKRLQRHGQVSHRTPKLHSSGRPRWVEEKATRPVALSQVIESAGGVADPEHAQRFHASRVNKGHPLISTIQTCPRPSVGLGLPPGVNALLGRRVSIQACCRLPTWSPSRLPVK